MRFVSFFVFTILTSAAVSMVAPQAQASTLFPDGMDIPSGIELSCQENGCMTIENPTGGTDLVLLANFRELSKKERRAEFREWRGEWKDYKKESRQARRAFRNEYRAENGNLKGWRLAFKNSDDFLPQIKRRDWMREKIAEWEEENGLTIFSITAPTQQNGTYEDNEIEILPTPIPATAWLMLGAIGGLAAFQRARKTRKA